MEHRELSIEETEEILKSGDFSNFLGAQESAFFEAKSLDYLKSDKDGPINLKLAKYVAGFANSAGGYIIFGLKTNKTETTRQDFVESLDFMEKDEIFIKEVKERISNVVYPHVNVVCAWFPSREEETLGLFTIFIPEQEEEKKYFYAKIKIDREVPKELFGIPIRNGNSTDWKCVDEVYTLSKSRPNNLQELEVKVNQRFERIEKLITKKEKEGKSNMEDILAKRIAQIKYE